MITSILAEAEAEAAPQAAEYSIAEIFSSGGPLMYGLVVLSVMALMVLIVCLWTTRESAVLPKKMMPSVEGLIRQKDYSGLLSMCNADGSSFARTVHVIIQFMQRNPRANIDEVREVASAEGSRQANILTRQISWLSDIAALSPMIGLLGTVLGMMSTFTEISTGQFDGLKQVGLAKGISEAMITTAAGLVLAIPSMAAYVFFRNVIQKRITDMEVAVTHVLSVISVQMDREQRLGNVAQRGAVTERMEDDF